MPKYSFSKKKNRLDLNDAGRRLKKKRKHKGLPSGYRHSLILAKRKQNKDMSTQDSRIGSKKLISLSNDANKNILSSTHDIIPETPMVSKNQLEKELHQLENDTKLEMLLDQIESQQAITQQEQDYVDSILLRIDELMTQLGYEYEDDENDNNKKDDDIMRLLKP